MVVLGDSDSELKEKQIGNASGTATLISTPSKFITKTSKKIINQKILELSKQNQFLTLMFSVQDFLVLHSVSLEKGKALMMNGGDCFLRLSEYLKLKNLNIVSLKTLKDYSITKKGKLIRQSSARFRKWGIILSGWCLTADFMEYPKTGKECLLSDVLESNGIVLHNAYKGGEGVYKKYSPTISTPCGGGHIPEFAYAIDANYCKGSNPKYSARKCRRTLVAQALDTSGNLYQGSSWNTKINHSARAVRKLSPKECERLQGFPDDWTEGVSNTQRYKQMGNAVTVNVIQVIIKAFKEAVRK